jgi:hypothetical protein
MREHDQFNCSVRDLYGSSKSEDGKGIKAGCTRQIPQVNDFIFSISTFKYRRKIYQFLHSDFKSCLLFIIYIDRPRKTERTGMTITGPSPRGIPHTDEKRYIRHVTNSAPDVDIAPSLPGIMSSSASPWLSTNFRSLRWSVELSPDSQTLSANTPRWPSSCL